ncbi:MAG: SpoIVB peptidase [Clostridia bacterium]
MKKLKIGLLLCILLIVYIYIANITLFPTSIILMQGEKLKVATLWGLHMKEIQNSNPNIGKYQNEKTMEASVITDQENSLTEVGKVNASLNLFDMFAIKNVNVSVIPKTTVIPLGNAMGLKLYTNGVLVVGMSEIEGSKPYENTGIEEGDMIVSINETTITCTADLIETVNESKGEKIQVTYRKDEQIQTASMIPVKTKENEYKLGLWVRDAAAGVGTATFYEPATGMFASLGHGITDVDTGNLITIANGELVTSNIVSVTKGERGKPGEIRGSIEGSKKVGEVSKNTAFGIFGKIINKNYLSITNQEMEVATREEIKTGKAQIICEIETGKRKTYEIEIQKIYTGNNQDNKSMQIKVTDEELLQKTGGIIQGMSGSPIIQNGKFVGAVTHVLVNDPTSGYGVFADMMLKQMRS